jgi:hypothetical protein
MPWCAGWSQRRRSLQKQIVKFSPWMIEREHLDLRLSIERFVWFGPASVLYRAYPATCKLACLEMLMSN